MNDTSWVRGDRRAPTRRSLPSLLFFIKKNLGVGGNRKPGQNRLGRPGSSSGQWVLSPCSRRLATRVCYLHFVDEPANLLGMQAGGAEIEPPIY